MNTILIYWLLSNSAILATPAAAVFSDAQACQAALADITEAWKGPSLSTVHQVIGFCEPQASAPPPATATCTNGAAPMPGGCALPLGGVGGMFSP